MATEEIEIDVEEEEEIIEVEEGEEEEVLEEMEEEVEVEVEEVDLVDEKAVVGEKRTAEIAVAKPAPAKQLKPSNVLVVYSKSASAGKELPANFEQLVGNYVEHGTNHDKKTYKRNGGGNSKDSNPTFLYFWDERDGQDYSGWWFGESVGGEVVWALHPENLPNPPAGGWKVPWNEGVNNDLAIRPASLAEAAKAGSAPQAEAPKVANQIAAAVAAQTTAKPAEPSLTDVSDDILKKATDMATAAESKASAALDGVKKAADADKSNGDALVEKEKLLVAEVTAINEAITKLQEFMTVARKAGNNTASAELRKLTPRLHSNKSNLNMELTKIKGQLSKLKQEKEAAALAKENEDRDLQLCEQSLKNVEKMMEAAEAATTRAVETAEALLAQKKAVEGGNTAETKEVALSDVRDIEKKTADARISLKLATSQNVEVRRVSQMYVPKAQQKAAEDCGKLTERGTTAQAKLDELADAARDYHERAKTEGVLKEVEAKLTPVEEEITKVVEEGKKVEVEQSGTTAEEIKTIEDLLKTSKSNLAKTVAFIELKNKEAREGGPLSESLKKYSARTTEAQESLAKVQKDLDERASKDIRQKAEDHTKSIDDLFQKVTNAEEPFADKSEVLSMDKAGPAIEACEMVAEDLKKATRDAATFIQTKIMETQRFGSEDVVKSTKEVLDQLRTKVDLAQKKTSEFTKQTAQRKTDALLLEVNEKVTKVEQQQEETAKKAKTLESSALADVSTEEIKERCAIVKKAEEDQVAAHKGALEAVSQKQREAGGQKGVMNLGQELGKLRIRCQTVQRQLNDLKLKSLIKAAEVVLQSRDLLAETQKKLDAAEAEVKKAEVATLPLEAGNETQLSEETIVAIDTAINDAQSVLEEVQKVAEANKNGILKDEFGKLGDRRKALLTTIDAVKSVTKEQHEKVAVELWLKKARELATAVEKAAETMDKADEPFLKGFEILPVEESNACIKVCEEAIAATQAALEDANKFFKDKGAELKAFAMDSKEAQGRKEKIEQGFAEIRKIVDSIHKAVQELKNETAERKKQTQLQELATMVVDLESDLKKAVEIAEPLKPPAVVDLDADEAKDSGEMKREEGMQQCEKFVEAEKPLVAKLSETLNSIHARRAEAKGNSSRLAEVEKLQANIRDIQDALKNSKKIVNQAEQRFKEKGLLEETTQVVNKVEEAVKKAKAKAAALVEAGGESFFAESVVRLLLSSVKVFMEKKALTKEDFYKQHIGKADLVDETSFVAFMEKLPELLESDSLITSKDMQLTIFKTYATEGKFLLGTFSKFFLGMFKCSNNISMTDGFDIAESKTLGKLEPGTVLEALAEPKASDQGLKRIECRNVKTGQSGWVTLQGTAGTQFLEQLTFYDEFLTDLQSIMTELNSLISEKLAWLQKSIVSVVSKNASGPFLQAKGELQEFQRQELHLKKAITTAKLELGSRTRNIAKDMEEERDRRKAQGILKDCKVEAELVDSLAQKAEEANSKFTELKEEDLQALKEPLTAFAAVEKTTKDIADAIVKAKGVHEENLEALKTATQGPLKEAKSDITMMLQKINCLSKKCATYLVDSQKAMDKITTTKRRETLAAIRTSIQGKREAMEDLFKKLAGAGSGIKQSSFCSYLSSLSGLSLSLEQQQLVFKDFSTGLESGIDKHLWMKSLQLYYQCAREVAITESFDVNATPTDGKSLRKLLKGEVLEVIEGPRSDANVGLTRVKGKTLNDGMEGWVSVEGNGGTAFLTEASKPYLVCTAETAMEEKFRVTENDQQNPEVREPLKDGDVVEVIEGPVKEENSRVQRVRAMDSDGAEGWLTLKDPFGNVHAKQIESQYQVSAKIGLTDKLDIKGSSIKRKMSIGEDAFVLEGPIEDTNSGIQRIRVKALKDDTEGWLTIKGNAGTEFVKETKKVYSITHRVPLHNQFSTLKAQQLRVFAPEDKIQVLLGPKEEKLDGVSRVKGRCLSDGKVGWMTMIGKLNLKPWSPEHKCIKETAVHEGFEVADAKVLRELVVGEIVELIDAPKKDDAAGALRVKGRAAKDGVTGWITISEDSGTKFLSSMVGWGEV